LWSVKGGSKNAAGMLELQCLIGKGVSKHEPLAPHEVWWVNEMKERKLEKQGILWEVLDLRHGEWCFVVVAFASATERTSLERELWEGKMLRMNVADEITVYPDPDPDTGMFTCSGLTWSYWLAGQTRSSLQGSFKHWQQAGTLAAHLPSPVTGLLGGSVFQWRAKWRRSTRLLRSARHSIQVLITL